MRKGSAGTHSSRANHSCVHWTQPYLKAHLVRRRWRGQRQARQCALTSASLRWSSAPQFSEREAMRIHLLEHCDHDAGKTDAFGEVAFWRISRTMFGLKLRTLGVLCGLLSAQINESFTSLSKWTQANAMQLAPLQISRRNSQDWFFPFGIYSLLGKGSRRLLSIWLKRNPQIC